MPSANYKRSETEASQIIAGLSLYDAPVPVFDIVTKKGLELVEYDLGTDTSGVLLIQNGKGTIGYNSKDPLVRKRFTVAHELGHFLLHGDSNELFVDSYFLMKYRGNNSYSEIEFQQEQEANAFAAALLMPTEFISKFLRNEEVKHSSETELINMLAAKFEVSVAAMSFRLANLNRFE